MKKSGLLKLLAMLLIFAGVISCTYSTTMQGNGLIGGGMSAAGFVLFVMVRILYD